MIKRISLVCFLFVATFADASILTSQLFWDPAATFDYASRLALHPPIPELPTVDELGLEKEARATYRSLSDDIYNLRSLRSKVVIAAKAVQDGALLMERRIPFIKNLVLGLFGRGFKSDITNLVRLESELKNAHESFMENDLKLLMNYLESSEDLSIFSGRIALPGKVTYLDLEIRASDMTGLTQMPLTIPVFPIEPSCIINTPDGSISLPKYMKDEYFPGVTSPCVPKSFYTEQQLDQFVFMVGPNWSEFERRLQWVQDIANYLIAVSNFVDDCKTDSRDKLDKTSLLVVQGEALNYLLSNSSVKLALSQLPGSSTLVASNGDIPELSEIAELQTEFIDLMNDIEKSKSLGETFLKCKGLVGKYSHVEALVGNIWPYLEARIESMESLCRSYGVVCEFDGELPMRLELTSKAFIEARIKYTLENQLEPTGIELSEDLIETELISITHMLENLEPHLSAHESLNYLDELSTLKQKLKLTKQLEGKRLSEGLDTLVFEIQEFREKVGENFFEKYRDVALKIRVELLTLSSFLKSKDIVVQVENREISAFSNFIDNTLYYLSKEPLLKELKEKHQALLKDFSSNVPSKTVCTPTKPILGEEFKVRCSILINNTWQVSLSSASSVLNLKYTPKHISSGNFVGDVSYISSISFSGETVRMNLKDLKTIAIFNLTYTSELSPAHYHCNYESRGLFSNARCFVISDCTFDKVLVPMAHPFSGREMNSTAVYYYDGSRILFEVPCGEATVSFYGPSVEVFSGEDGLVIRNLINSTTEFMLEIPQEELPSDVPVVIGAILEPLEEKNLELQTTFKVESSLEGKTQFNETLQLSKLSEFDESNSLAYIRFGCVEDNIVSEVLNEYRLPALSCVELNGIEEVKKLLDDGSPEKALKLYTQVVNDVRLESFLAKSAKYKNNSLELLEQALSMNPISTKISQKYIEKAKAAYENKDYITSMYYARYAMLKSTIKLSLDLRVIFAIAIIAYGVYSSRTKKEELI